MSEDEEKSKEISPYRLSSDSISSIVRSAKLMAEFQQNLGESLERQRSVLGEAVFSAARSLKGVKEAAEKMAWLTQKPRLALPNSPIIEYAREQQRVIQTRKALEDAEETIDVIPEALEEASLEIQPLEKQEWLSLYNEVKDELVMAKNEIESLSQRLETLEQEKRKAIEPLEYPFPLINFRASMDRFLAVNGKTFKGTWEGHQVEYEIGYFLPAQTQTREVWNVYFKEDVVINSKRPQFFYAAMILATEDRPNLTAVEFIDGQCYQKTSRPTPRTSTPELGSVYLDTLKPIGYDFIKIAEWIKAGLYKAQTPSILLQKLINNPIRYKQQGQINLQTKPAGRKIDPCNPIAFDIMYDGQPDSNLRAFEYWCKEKGIKNPTPEDRKNFKKAMRRERERRGGEIGG